MDLPHRMVHGCIEQVCYRQALPAWNCLSRNHEALHKFPERVGGEGPIFRFARESKLGVARLDEHAHERGHLRAERRWLSICVAVYALSCSRNRQCTGGG